MAGQIALTEKALLDYIRCPAYYDMRHKKGAQVDNEKSFQQLLDTIARNFYTNIFSGKIPRTGDLKRKWDRIIDENPDVIDEKKAVEGMGLIMSLYRWAREEEMIVLDIDTPYAVLFGNTEIKGNIGTILSTPGGGYELLITRFSRRLPDQSMIDMKLSYTLAAYAFEKSTGKTLDGIRVHSVKHGKDFYTSRNQVDYRRLVTSVENVGKAIEQGIYFPSENLCSTCELKTFCKYWSPQ